MSAREDAALELLGPERRGDLLLALHLKSGAVHRS